MIWKIFGTDYSCSVDGKWGVVGTVEASSFDLAIKRARTNNISNGKNIIVTGAQPV